MKRGARPLLHFDAEGGIPLASQHLLAYAEHEKNATIGPDERKIQVTPKPPPGTAAVSRSRVSSKLEAEEKGKQGNSDEKSMAKHHKSEKNDTKATALMYR